MSGWPLAPLLATRTRQEERAAVDEARAFTLLGAAERATRAALRAVAEARAVACRATTVVELVAGARFDERLRAEVRAAIDRANALRAAAESARTEHLAARRRRRALETLRERWMEDRRLRLEAAEEDLMEDVVATMRRYPTG